jgi:hypothetical protein
MQLMGIKRLAQSIRLQADVARESEFTSVSVHRQLPGYKEYDLP